MKHRREFRPLIGGTVQHVTHPQDHRGYMHLVARQVYAGSMAGYTAQLCAMADQLKLPKNVISFNPHDGTYVTVDRIDVNANDGGKNRQIRDGIVAYVKELTAYNEAGGR